MRIIHGDRANKKFSNRIWIAYWNTSTMTSMSRKHMRPGASLTGNNAEMCGQCRVNTLKYVLLPERQGIMIGFLESRERPE